MNAGNSSGIWRSIWHEPETGDVCIIDQTRLPHSLETRALKTLADACAAIRDMRVRGAPLIGVTAAFGVYLALRENPASLPSAIDQLRATRPTAVNLRWALARAQRALAGTQQSGIAARALRFAVELAAADAACCAAIGEHGSGVLRGIWQQKNRPDEPLRVLTHCNAGALATVEWGTALAVIHKAAAGGVPLHVWVDETRPRNQGAALTCWELRRAGIDHSLIVDSAAGHAMASGLVDVCVTGSDRVSAAGDVCNKIGTYQVALAASDNALPFYVALPVSTIDFDWPSMATPIPIEERDAAEVSHATGIDVNKSETRIRQYPEQTPIRNFAFDITPARLVTGIITEHGVFEANQNSLVALAGDDHRGRVSRMVKP